MHVVPMTVQFSKPSQVSHLSPYAPPSGVRQRVPLCFSSRSFRCAIQGQIHACTAQGGAQNFVHNFMGSPSCAPFFTISPFLFSSLDPLFQVFWLERQACRFPSALPASLSASAAMQRGDGEKKKKRGVLPLCSWDHRSFC